VLWLTLEETAALLRKSRSQVSRDVSSGKLVSNGEPNTKGLRVRADSLLPLVVREARRTAATIQTARRRVKKAQEKQWEAIGRAIKAFPGLENIIDWISFISDKRRDPDYEKWQATLTRKQRLVLMDVDHTERLVAHASSELSEWLPKIKKARLTPKEPELD
jgi:hypothetical protein